jgi:hypothetical protein
MSPGAGLAADSLATQQIEQEVGKRGTREAPVVFEQAEQPVVAGVETILLIPQPLAAHLHEVAALVDRQVVAVVKRVGDVVLDHGGTADRRETAAHGDRAQPWVGLSARDTEARIAVAKAAPIEDVGDEHGTVESDASLVDDCGLDDTRPVEGDVLGTVEALARELNWQRTLDAIRVEVGKGVSAGHVVRS